MSTIQALLSTATGGDISRRVARVPPAYAQRRRDLSGVGVYPQRVWINSLDVDKWRGRFFSVLAWLTAVDGANLLWHAGAESRVERLGNYGEAGGLSRAPATLARANSKTSSAYTDRWRLGNHQLLVVIHGSEFICYVNDQFVGAVTDEGAPTTGYMGLYLNDQSAEGIYNNFAVYKEPELPASPLPFGLTVSV